MPYVKGFNKVTRHFNRSVKKYGRKTNQTKKLVDGKSMASKAESIIAGGAPYIRVIPQLIRDVSLIRDMINVEPKFVDTSGNGTISTTGVLGILSLLAQGNTDQQRNGNQVKLKDIKIQIDIGRNAAAASNRVRAMLIVDKEFDGALPTIANVLQTSNVLSPLNKDYSKRFVVLKTKHFMIDASMASKSFTWYCKLPFHGFYDGTTAAAADCKENQILLLLLEDQAINVASYAYYARINFYDN